MSLRAAFGAIVVGLLASLGIFFWTEYQTGRLGEVVAFWRYAENTRPPAVVTRPAPLHTPTAVSPTASAVSPPTRPVATAVPTRGVSRPTTVPTARGTPTESVATSSPSGPVQVSISAAELNTELQRQATAGGLPLVAPVLVLAAPDRLILRGTILVAVFQVPVEVEARISVDDDGVLRVATTRVEAVGSNLPPSVAAALGQQIDVLGGQAVRSALPVGSRARQVDVQPERITVDLDNR